MDSAALSIPSISPENDYMQLVSAVIWDTTVTRFVLDLCLKNVVICLKFHIALKVWKKTWKKSGLFFHPLDY